MPLTAVRSPAGTKGPRRGAVATLARLPQGSIGASPRRMLPPDASELDDSVDTTPARDDGSSNARADAADVSMADDSLLGTDLLSMMEEVGEEELELETELELEAQQLQQPQPPPQPPQQQQAAEGKKKKKRAKRKGTGARQRETARAKAGDAVVN